MHQLLKMLTKLIHRKNRPSADERYLAQSLDIYEFEVRLQALERSRA
jgi:hypothetical protein